MIKDIRDVTAGETIRIDDRWAFVEQIVYTQGITRFISYREPDGTPGVAAGIESEYRGERRVEVDETRPFGVAPFRHGLRARLVTESAAISSSGVHSRTARWARTIGDIEYQYGLAAYSGGLAVAYAAYRDDWDEEMMRHLIVSTPARGARVERLIPGPGDKRGNVRHEVYRCDCGATFGPVELPEPSSPGGSAVIGDEHPHAVTGEPCRVDLGWLLRVEATRAETWRGFRRPRR